MQIFPVQDHVSSIWRRSVLPLHELTCIRQIIAIILWQMLLSVPTSTTVIVLSALHSLPTYTDSTLLQTKASVFSPILHKQAALITTEILRHIRGDSICVQISMGWHFLVLQLKLSSIQLQWPWYCTFGRRTDKRVLAIP